MTNYSIEENRIVAFIYIEGSIFTHKYHTECVTEYLKHKNKIKDDVELYNLLHSSKEHIARNWLSQIEENCIFGEISNYNNEVVTIIFDDLTELGLCKIKEVSFKYGIKKVLKAVHVGGGFIFKEI